MVYAISFTCACAKGARARVTAGTRKRSLERGHAHGSTASKKKCITTNEYICIGYKMEVYAAKEGKRYKRKKNHPAFINWYIYISAPVRCAHAKPKRNRKFEVKIQRPFSYITNAMYVCVCIMS